VIYAWTYQQTVQRLQLAKQAMLFTIISTFPLLKGMLVAIVQMLV